jgi:hypothetical protein
MRNDEKRRGAPHLFSSFRACGGRTPPLLFPRLRGKPDGGAAARKSSDAESARKPPSCFPASGGRAVGEGISHATGGGGAEMYAFVGIRRHSAAFRDIRGTFQRLSAKAGVCDCARLRRRPRGFRQSSTSRAFRVSLIQSSARPRTHARRRVARRGPWRAYGTFQEQIKG